MRVLDDFEYGDLTLQQSTSDLALQVSRAHFFDCYWGAVALVDAVEDLTKAALT